MRTYVRANCPRNMHEEEWEREKKKKKKKKKRKSASTLFAEVFFSKDESRSPWKVRRVARRQAVLE